jgi:eukaryotic-like serine/threonine-protein kinase
MSGPVRLTVGSTFASDYKVVRALHESNERAVYAVEQVSTGKPLALKVVSPDLAPDDESRARFTDEARVGGKINSPYLVDVRAAGIDTASGLPFVVMELLEGEDLGTALRKSDQKPPLASWDELLSQLLRGLAAAHFAGVAHGALTPSAIFLARPGPGDDVFRLQLLDLGVPTLARSAGAEEADRLPFQAPEQLSAEGASARTSSMDVWAVGLIAFRVLSGKHYFKAANAASPDAAALSAEIAAGATQPASARAQAIGVSAPLPRAFDAWFQRCTEKDPAKRFPDASAAFDGATDLFAEASSVGAEIEEVADEPEAGQGGPRKGPPPLPPMLRAIAENPKPAILAIVLLVAVALVGGMGLGALRGTPKNSNADGARAKATGWAVKGAAESRKACDGGEPSACAGLAQLLLAGRGVEKNEAEAAKLFGRACEKGDMPACGALALQHMNGDGVPRSPGTASEYYRKACDGGDYLSCADFAEMYKNGNGVPKDEAQAKALLEKACKAGLAEVCVH